MLSVLFIHSIMHLCDAKIVERLISSWQISENSQILEESKYRKVIFLAAILVTGQSIHVPQTAIHVLIKHSGQKTKISQIWESDYLGRS